MLEEVEGATRCCHSGELRQGVTRVGDGAQRQPDNDCVECPVRKRQASGIGGDQFDLHRAFPGTVDCPAQHPSVIVDSDDEIGFPVVGDIEPGADGDLENPSGCGGAELSPLMAETESILGDHEQVVDAGKHRVRSCRHIDTLQVGRLGVSLRRMTEAPSKRTEVRRLPERGRYDRGLINSILDEALICHVGFVHEGAPVVIPSIHARVGDTLYLHGSPASRMLRSMRSGDEISVNVTLLDGLVVARAAFHNSMNYRSVVVFGSPRIVTDADEKWDALEAITEHVVPGRWADSRPMTEKEMKGTLVVALPLGEASAKVRAGGPGDDDEDYGLPIWAGVIPLTLTPGEPVVDELLRVDVPVPPYVGKYKRPN